MSLLVDGPDRHSTRAASQASFPHPLCPTAPAFRRRYCCESPTASPWARPQVPEKISVALLRGTTADLDGNVSFEREALYLDQLNQASRFRVQGYSEPLSAWLPHPLGRAPKWQCSLHAATWPVEPMRLVTPLLPHNHSAFRVRMSLQPPGAYRAPGQVPAAPLRPRQHAASRAPVCTGQLTPCPGCVCRPWQRTTAAG